MSLKTSRMAQAERNARNRLAREIPWPLPVRGLFSEASRSELSGQLADTLNNFISTGIALEMRDGYTKQSDNAANQRIPFVFGDEDAYVEITDGAAKFGAINFARSFPADVCFTEISSNLIMADGTGDIIRFDGALFSNAGFTTDTGKSSSEFDGVFSHQDRIYAWDSGELEFYYGDIGAVTGELTRFPLGRLGNITGNITLISAMTINAAHGMNDILVIVTSTGWVVLYEGLDPGDANDWRLLGRVKVARPVSKFAVSQFGADLWVLTNRGIVSIRESLAQGVMALVSSVAKPISDLIVADVKAYGSQSGWNIETREDGDEVIVNVPTAAGYKQYVYRVIAQAWQTSDYPSKWWHDVGGQTEFTGSDGKLYRLADAVGDNGSEITATFHTSWIRIGREAELAYLIPTIIADGALTVKITVLTDHNATDGDIVQAEQTITIEPDNAGSSVSLDEIVGVNAAGRVFQARFEVTGINVSFENLIAGIV